MPWRLARKRRRFRLIVDSIPAFAWYAGMDGKIEYLNQRILDRRTIET